MALEIKIEMTGLTEMIQALKDMPGEVAKEVRKAQEEDLRDVASVLGDYPPQKPGTKYIRTGDLGFGWVESIPRFSNAAGLNFNVSISNPVKYAGDVQGGPGDNPSQRREFKDRNWKTTDQALAETEDRAQKRLEKAVQKGLGKFDRQKAK